MSFSDWWTNSNNPSLPKSEYLFGTRHITLLLTTLILCIILTIIFRKKSDKAKRILFLTFGFIFLFFEILSRIVNLIILDNYTVENIAKIILPMHICSVMVWVFIFAIFTKKQFLIKFSVVGGILATTAFLLYPAVGINQTYMAFTNIYSTVSHMLGFICCILLMTLGQVKFEIKKIWQTYLCLAIMFLWGVLLDFVIFPGSDYMYIVNDPLELGLSFPYQILYGIVIIIYTFAYYGIYWLIKRKNMHIVKKIG